MRSQITDMILKIHPENPSERKIKAACDILSRGGVIICPTDSVYGFICAIDKKKAFEKICQLKGMKPDRATLSMMFESLSQSSKYVAQLENQTFRMLKKNLPGPFTFILKAGQDLPSFFHGKKKTLGVRIPDHSIVQALLQMMGQPLFVASLHSEDDILEYHVDPEEIYSVWGNRVDAVIDGGAGRAVPSAVIDCIHGEPELIREGPRELII